MAKKLTKEQFEAIVGAAIDDAQDYVDSDPAKERQLAQKFYRGDKFGNEEEGRSQIVLTEVRDTVLAMMPSLMRVFAGSENAVEFAPRRSDAVEMAEQATDYVNFVFMSDNDGYSLLFSAIKDALLLKTGIFKWWTEKKTTVEHLTYSGLTAEDLAALAAEPDLEIKSITPSKIVDDSSQNESETEEDEAEDGPASAEEPPSPPNAAQEEAPVAPTEEIEQYFDVKAIRKTTVVRQKVMCVPPEEFIIARNARDLDNADLVGHRCFKTMSELIDMGFKEDDIREKSGGASSFEMNTEAQERNPGLLEFLGKNTAVSTDKSMERFFYTECYIRVDKDGDGIAELRRVCTIGDSHAVLFDEPVPYAKMAVLCPDPTPHMVIGGSVADQIVDLQLIKSMIMRSTLDSLAQTINPRTAVVEGQVNLDDVMNTEVGGIIRTTAIGAVQPLTEAFVGQQAFPYLQYLDDVRAQRTGISKASQGLDPDVLQSTTKSAVTATMSAAQERLELIARTLAETGFKRLFRGLLREIIAHQDKPRMVRLRNKWVEVDPSKWDADMDVIVNVGIGTGNVEQKTALLMQVVQKHEAVMKEFGVANNPLVTMKQYRDTMAQILAINGMREGARYFKEITPEVEAQMNQPQPPQPDPATLVAQAEVGRIQAQGQIDQAKLMLDAEKAKREDDRLRDKQDMDFFLAAQELQVKYGVQLDVERLYAQIQRERDQVKSAADLFAKLNQPKPVPGMNPAGGMQ